MALIAFNQIRVEIIAICAVMLVFLVFLVLQEGCCSSGFLVQFTPG